jgi:hypothetical protein
LLSFRPQLERIAVTVGSDRYPREVEEVFALLGHPVWDLPDYDPDQAVAWLADPEFVARADVRQVRAMLTACARGERFCDGWWGAVLRDGRLFRVLDRLGKLPR